MKKVMKLNKAVSAVAVCAALTSFGDVFPNADGKGDLASAASWGGAVPAAGTEVSLTPSFEATNYTFSSTVTFGQLLVPYANYGTSVSKYLNVVFDQTPYGDGQPLVKLGGIKLCDSKSSPYPYINMVFKGGTYDLQKQVITGVYDHENYPNRVILTDGCVMTNALGWSFGYPATSRLELYGGSKFVSYRDESGSTISFCYGYGTDNGITVKGGSSLDMRANDIYVFGTGGSGGRVLVSGENSYARFRGGYVNYTGGSRAKHFAVEDGAHVDMTTSYLTMPDGACTAECRLTVSNATMQLPGMVRIGQAANANKCHLEFVNATITGGQTDFYLGYVSGNQTLVMSNAVVNMSGDICIGRFEASASSTNNTVYVQGAANSFPPLGAYSLFQSDHNRIIVEKGAKTKLWSRGAFSARSTSGVAGASNNRVIVRDGGTLTDLPSTGEYANSKAVSGATNNWIVVEEGGVVTGSADISGRWCGFKVDDGTMYGNIFVAVRDPGDWYDWGTNCFLTVSGDHPQICCTNANSFVQVRRHSTVTFEIPEDGYAAGYATEEKPLVSADTIEIDGTTTLAITGVGAAKKTCKSNEFVLLSAKTLTLPDAVVAAAQAAIDAETASALKPRLKKVVCGDRTNLVLKLRRPGLIVTVR